MEAAIPEITLQHNAGEITCEQMMYGVQCDRRLTAPSRSLLSSQRRA